jgi:acyl-CoA reductase-like NAD-dependent aldehyde dehydrogenase
MQATATNPRAEAAPAIVPMLIGGQWREGRATSDVIDPYRGEPVARAPGSTQGDLNDALDAAVAARAQAAAMPGFERAKLLRRVIDLLLERADDIALTMARETGKAIKDARAEVVRSQDTVSLAAEEAIRIEGSHVPLDGSAMGAGKLAMLLRVPVGVVAGITPFNAPFNLACHKVAPDSESPAPRGAFFFSSGWKQDANDRALWRTCCRKRFWSDVKSGLWSGRLCGMRQH